MCKVWILCLLVVPLLIAYMEYKLKFRKIFHQKSITREYKAMIGLDITIGSNKTNFERVAVGVNANVDLILPVTKLFEKLGIKASSNPQNHDNISSLDELEECFSYYFKKCAAAERFVTSMDLFNTIVNAARKVDNAQYDVGGNAALMGLKMVYSSSNSTVMLGGPIGPQLEVLLDKKIIIPELLRKESDEYHLILEYPVGEVWGDHVSTCANRFIISHDVANGQMTAMGNFFESVKAFGSDMVVVSGLHLLEGQPSDIKMQKILELKLHLIEIPYNIPIHLELAGMTSSQFMKDIAENIFPVIDSIGLNEQELAFISTSLNGPGAGDELSQWPPEIGLMGDIIDWLLQTFGKNIRYGSSSSRLTRIHFHCLTYHIMAVHPNTWANSLVATAAGSRAASRQACDKENLETTDVELRTPEVFARSVKFWELRRLLVKGDKANPVTSWNRGGIDFHFSAVLVCKHPKRTVGLGDCISATGLQYSIFLNR